MNSDDRVKESFSAWLDDEANDMDLQRLLKSLEAGLDPIETYGSLARVSHLADQNGFRDISGAIHATIEKQDVELVESVRPRKYQWQLVASFAVVAVLMVPVAIKNPWLAEQIVAMDQGNKQALVTQSHIMVASQSRLNGYLQQHFKQASLSSGKVSLPVNISMNVGS